MIYLKLIITDVISIYFKIYLSIPILLTRTLNYKCVNNLRVQILNLLLNQNSAHPRMIEFFSSWPEMEFTDSHWDFRCAPPSCSSCPFVFILVTPLFLNTVCSVSFFMKTRFMHSKVRVTERDIDEELSSVCWFILKMAEESSNRPVWTEVRNFISDSNTGCNIQLSGLFAALPRSLQGLELEVSATGTAAQIGCWLCSRCFHHLYHNAGLYSF